MNACLAILADNPSLTRGVERAAKEAGLDLTRIEENGSSINLQPRARQAVRSARIFIAAVTQRNLQDSNILYGLGIAKSGQVPIVVVSDDSIPLNLEGPILGEIPKENVFSLTSSGFVPDLTGRLRELASRVPISEDGFFAKVRSQSWFLSYAGEDQAYADELVEFLTRYNLAYRDYDHHRYGSNTVVAEEIYEAIDSSAGIIVSYP
jgi:hypothetical protein